MAATASASAEAVYRIAVLASGRGSNLQALIDAIAGGALDASIVGVFSDQPTARALQRGRAAGIPVHALDPATFATRAEFDEALFARIERDQPALIVCAGYLRLIDAGIVESRHGRIVNIHPSLLPAFRGLHTHRRALAAGVTEHGASVHFVTADLDGGPLIAQAVVPVRKRDTAAALARRVLRREHPLLVATVRLLAAGRLALIDDSVHLDGSALAAPLQLAATDRFA